MTGPYRGSCLCGVVSFEADEFEGNTAHCHCSMCRKFHGAAFATIASVQRSMFRWLSGKDSLVGYIAPNGTTRTFCRHCGSSLLFSSPRADPDIVEIALGAFDGDVPIRPSAHIFVGSAANWTCIVDDLPQYETTRASAKVEG